MVAEGKETEKLVEKVAEIYNWLDSQILKNKNRLAECRACGSCCAFDKFDHKLFVTTPELLYLAANIKGENIKPMINNRCPYNVEGKCSIYKYRFAGCRIFFCKGDADLQNEMSELALKKLKSICMELQFPYRYRNLAGALNSFAGG